MNTRHIVENRGPRKEIKKYKKKHHYLMIFIMAPFVKSDHMPEIGQNFKTKQKTFLETVEKKECNGKW